MVKRARTRAALSRAAAVFGVVAGTVASAVLVTVPAAAAPTAALAGPVSTKPAAGTPQLAMTRTPEQVRQLAECGSTMYAVGSFTSIRQGSTVYSRNNIFSFRATAPFTVTSWNPGVNGTVNSIAFNGGSCADAYIGGKFTSVDGTKATDIAEVSTATGAVVSGFGHTANGEVETLAVSRGHLLTGGFFTSVNGSPDRYFASLNPATGKDDGYLHLGISGNIQFPGVTSNRTRVYNQQISHGGALELVEGDFTSVGGLPRQQIFMLSLGSATATVTGWTSPEFSQHCVAGEPFYVRAASWSPDDSTIYTASTGFHPLTGFPHAGGLCDAAAAFPATRTSASHIWINYTGCFSLYSTAADSGAAYFGGHELYASDPNGCKSAGPGAVNAPGMVGLSPANGTVVWNPTRSRGFGADDMLVTRAGLWIASDNFDGSDQCGHVAGHAGICFMPYG